MLFRLVRSVKRSGSSQLQFTQRIPADVLPRAGGLKLSIPMGGGEFHHLTISPKAQAVRFSLRTRDPSAGKVRHGTAAAFLESVWQSLRASKPLVLNHRLATALAGELYRAWASERPQERTTAIVLRHDRSGWDREYVEPAEETAGFNAIVAKLKALHDVADPAELEPVVGPLVDRLRLARGVAAVEPHSRSLLLGAFVLALSDAFENRARNATGDYSPDAKAQRFPEWAEAPAALPVPTPTATGKVSLKGLVESWWKEEGDGPKAQHL